MRQALAENMRICRAIRNWSQTRLALEANLSPTTICELESGARKWKSELTIERIAKALGVSVSELEQAGMWRGYGALHMHSEQAVEALHGSST